MAIDKKTNEAITVDRMMATVGEYREKDMRKDWLRMTSARRSLKCDEQINKLYLSNYCFQLLLSLI